MRRGKACAGFSKTQASDSSLLEGYEGTKSAVHFTADRPLPTALVRKLIRARIAEGKAKRRR